MRIKKNVIWDRTSVCVSQKQQLNVNDWNAILLSFFLSVNTVEDKSGLNNTHTHYHNHFWNRADL